jgi:hypothetical protein
VSRFKVVSTALIAAAVLATPALARQNHTTSQHLTENADANTTIGVGHNDWRSCYDNSLTVLRGELCGYRGGDVWGHWSGYYGPMIGVP